MTEYWVSQGNKWCDFCKIFISNNPSSIRNHELGTRHKEAVGKRLDDVRKKNVEKEKSEKAALKALEQIEAKARSSYQKDVVTFQKARESNLQAFEGSANEWEYDNSTGYHYNRSNGFYYDPNSGFYYCDTLGKWVTREEALTSPHYSSASKQLPAASNNSLTTNNDKDSRSSLKSGPAPGRVVSTPLNPLRNVKGKESSIAVAKRKREEESKPKAKQKQAKPVSAEEAAALKAREAAKKRVQDREAPLLGLYRP